jgi:hypothetical protein
MSGALAHALRALGGGDSQDMSADDEEVAGNINS